MSDELRILEQLEKLNAQAAKQNSYGRMFITGIVYGIGFFVGSAIIATIVFGLVAPFAGQIKWVHDAFVGGLDTLRK
jgi:hypothetical protein